MDTVFPKEHAFQEQRWLDEDTLNGPGLADMKGGIVQALFALEAVRELSIELPAAPVFFLVSDEETGSRSSKERTISSKTLIRVW